MNAKLITGITIVVLLAVSLYYFTAEEGGAGLGALPMITTITTESPTIQIGEKQYKQSGDIVINSIIEKTYPHAKTYFKFNAVQSTEEKIVIAKFPDHELVINVDRTVVKKGFASSSYVYRISDSLTLTEAYLDAQFVETSSPKISASSFASPTDYYNLGHNQIDEVFVPVQDIIVKIQREYTQLEDGYWNYDTLTGSCSGVNYCLSGESTEPRWSKAIYRISFYVPAEYFITPTCGDSNCDLSETCKTCPQDCGLCQATCGDQSCDESESYLTCPTDCEPPAPYCGDTWCNADESCGVCSIDCGSCIIYHCGDGTCNGDETCLSCIQDCGACPGICGNDLCDGGETCESCTQDCGVCEPRCGDGRCNGDEDCSSCSIDCGVCPPYCGDGTCGGDETCRICQTDCGACPAYCGDGTCNLGETVFNCPIDCGYSNNICGDDICAEGEDCHDCSKDCGNCPPTVQEDIFLDIPEADIDKLARLTELRSKQVLTSWEENELDYLEEYEDEYLKMRRFITSHVDNCYANDGVVYDFLEYRCDGFPTEFTFRSLEFPEFNINGGCCLAGFGVSPFSSPIIWHEGSDAPDFLRTKVDIGAFNYNFDYTYALECAEETDNEGFLYDPLLFECNDRVGTLDPSSGFACCATNGTYIEQPDEPVGGGGSEEFDYTWILIILALLLAGGAGYYFLKR